jgi:hypothetical protein
MGLHCVGCGATSDQGFLWRAFIEGGGDDESATEVVCYCPRCAEREFGPRGSPSRRKRDRKGKRHGPRRAA